MALTKCVLSISFLLITLLLISIQTIATGSGSGSGNQERDNNERRASKRPMVSQSERPRRAMPRLRLPEWEFPEDEVAEPEPEPEAEPILVQARRHHRFLQFTTKTHIDKFEKLVKCKINPIRSISWDYMRTVNQYDRLNSIIPPDTPWRRLFDIDEPSYDELVIEFYSTYQYEPNANPDAPSVSFRICNVPCCLSLRQFAILLGIYTEEETQSFDSIPFRIPFDPGRYWSTLSPAPWEKNVYSHTMYDPLHRYMHRVMAGTVRGRASNQDRVSNIDLFHMYCIFNRGVCNIAHSLAVYFQYYRAHVPARIMGGAYITRIAIRMGILGNEEIAILSPPVLPQVIDQNFVEGVPLNTQAPPARTVPMVYPGLPHLARPTRRNRPALLTQSRLVRPTVAPLNPSLVASTISQFQPFTLPAPFQPLFTLGYPLTAPFQPYRASVPLASSSSLFPPGQSSQQQYQLPPLPESFTLPEQPETFPDQEQEEWNPFLFQPMNSSFLEGSSLHQPQQQQQQQRQEWPTFAPLSVSQPIAQISEEQFQASFSQPLPYFPQPSFPSRPHEAGPSRTSPLPASEPVTLDSLGRQMRRTLELMEWMVPAILSLAEILSITLAPIPPPSDSDKDS